MACALKRLFTLGLLLSGLCLASSCVGPSDHPLDFSDNGSTIKLSTGDTITIELDANPSTGYLWIFGSPFDPNLLIMTSESYTKPEGPKERVGAPVKRLMTFKAIAPGNTGLKLDYRRPWERSEKPVKSFEILIKITGDPLEEPPKDDETPRVGSNGKVAKDPAAELFGK